LVPLSGSNFNAKKLWRTGEVIFLIFCVRLTAFVKLTVGQRGGFCKLFSSVRTGSSAYCLPAVQTTELPRELNGTARNCSSMHCTAGVAPNDAHPLIHCRLLTTTRVSRRRTRQPIHTRAHNFQTGIARFEIDRTSSPAFSPPPLPPPLPSHSCPYPPNLPALFLI
jgi:hypothetical protein